MKKKIAIFTGAGISVESGIEAFRSGVKALWGEYDVETVATPAGWHKNPVLVTDFYNKRREQLATVEPNVAHKALAELEERYEVSIITQNIDDLHERAGSTMVHKLHGDLKTVRSTINPDELYDWGYKAVDFDEDRAENDARLRPHVVWFGEYPDNKAVNAGYDDISNCDILLIIGTSLQIGYTIQMLGSVSNEAEIYYIDPNPAKYLDQYGVPVTYIEKDAVEGVSEIVNILMNR